MRRNTIGEARGDIIFNITNYIFVIVLFFLVMYPLIYVLSASVSSTSAIISGKVWLWPVDITFDGYKAVFAYKKIWMGYYNSLIYAFFGSMINILMTVIAAYPLSRKDLVGRNQIMFIFAFTMLFGGGMIPTFLVIKDLGLLDTRWAILIPPSLGVWNIVITTNYFKTNIPHELLEAATIDGCDDFRFLWKMVLPLSLPILAVVGLYGFVGHWNSFFDALLYLRNTSLQPLQIFLREILVMNNANDITNINAQAAAQNFKELLKYALIVVSAFPLLMIYPFVQRYFIQGIMVGSIKG